MKHLSTLFFLAIMLLGTLTCRGQAANAAPDPAKHAQIGYFQDSVHSVEDQIKSWEFSAKIQVLLMVCVAAFGAAIPILNRFKSKGVELTIAILSSAITLITAVSAFVFSANYRALHRAVNDGKIIVERLDGIIAVFITASPSPAEAEVFKADFNKKMDQFEQIERSIEGSNDSVKTAAVNLFDISPVLAQSAAQAPPWVAHSPADSNYLYFVGEGRDSSISTSKASSYNDAFNQLAAALGIGPPYKTSDASRTLLQEASVVQDTYFSYDSTASTYTYYTLLRINRAFSRLQASTSTYRRQGWRPVDMAFDPVLGLFVLDDNGGVSGITVDQSGIHVQLLFEIGRTDRPATMTVNDQSIFVSSNSNLGCMVYQYSLSGGKISKRLVRDGQAECDGIAAAGNAIYLSFPSLNKVHYWLDWSSHSSSSWSFNFTHSLQQINMASVLHYDEFGHRLIYADSSGTSYSISLPGGQLSYMIDNLGYVHAIAADTSRILFASGKKVLFVDRVDNRGQNPPDNMRNLTGGLISGVAVDASDAAWIADFDNNLIKGPFPLR